MNFDVPQYVDIEDRIFGPLTARQLGWLFGLGATVIFLFYTLQTVYFYMSVVPIGIFFLVMAFVRPQGMPMNRFAGVVIAFLFKPKVYIWKRGGDRINITRRKQKKEEMPLSTKKKISRQELHILAQTLDSEKEILNKRL
jgi:hypothetical protein